MTPPSNSYSGMDISQVRSLARQMQTEAAEIEALLQRLTAQLEGAPWRGTDRDRFLDEWRSRHLGALRRVADGLERAAEQANEHARRQEWASRA